MGNACCPRANREAEEAAQQSLLADAFSMELDDEEAVVTIRHGVSISYSSSPLVDHSDVEPIDEGASAGLLRNMTPPSSPARRAAATEHTGQSATASLMPLQLESEPEREPEPEPERERGGEGGAGGGAGGGRRDRGG